MNDTLHKVILDDGKANILDKIMMERSRNSLFP